MILYRYVKGDIRPDRVTVYTKKPVRMLRDAMSGETFLSFIATMRKGWKTESYMAAEVVLQPGVFRKLSWE